MDGVQSGSGKMINPSDETIVAGQWVNGRPPSIYSSQPK